MIAELLGPVPNSPEADTQSLGDLGMSQATESEQTSSLQPTFFHLALSQFARAPHDRNDAKISAREEVTYLKLNRAESKFRRVKGHGGMLALLKALEASIRGQEAGIERDVV